MIGRGLPTRPSVAAPQLWPSPSVPEELDPAGLGAVDTRCRVGLRASSDPLGAKRHPGRSASGQIETRWDGDNKAQAVSTQ